MRPTLLFLVLAASPLAAQRPDTTSRIPARLTLLDAIRLGRTRGVGRTLAELNARIADTRVREPAIFWVAQKAGKRAVATLKDAVENDPEVAVKKKAVFALSQLPKDEAVPELLHVAQTNANPVVRKEAIFWLGQAHDPRALAYFEKVLER